MQSVFIMFLNVSIAASWAIIAVMLLRLVLKLIKAPYYIMNILWAIIGLRLVMPFSITSAFSLIPSVNTLPTDIMHTSVPQIHTGINDVNIMVQPIIRDIALSAPQNELTPIQIATLIASIVWVIGVAAMLIYAVVSCLILAKKLKTASKLRDNIYTCNIIQSAFVFGIPAKIYVSSSVNNNCVDNIILHEMAHIKRKDHIIKPIAYLLLCINWYNPLVWIAYIMLCRDIESACDQKVIKNMNSDERVEYSQSLLDCSGKQSNALMYPVAFGEVSVKSRIKGILSYKKPTIWVIIATLCVCVAALVCFLTDPLVGDEALIPTEQPTTEQTANDICVLQQVQYPVELDAKKEFTVNGINGKTFSLYSSHLYEVIDGKYHMLYDENNTRFESMKEGYILGNIYLADVTCDGTPDFCFSTGTGSGIVTNHITVFDYVNKKEYILGTRGTGFNGNDYTLVENNGVLYARLDKGLGKSTTSIGKLRYRNIEDETNALYMDTNTYQKLYRKEEKGMLLALNPESCQGVLTHACYGSSVFGKYEIKDNKLMLSSNESVIVFDVYDDLLIFNKDESVISTELYNEYWFKTYVVDGITFTSSKQ